MKMGRGPGVRVNDAHRRSCYSLRESPVAYIIPALGGGALVNWIEEKGAAKLYDLIIGQ